MLRFRVLTAARSGEAREAVWHEIVFDAREWRIPAECMTMKTGHRVPLPDAALAVLDEARALRNGSGLVFPSIDSGKRIAGAPPVKLQDAVGLGDRATMRGFRSSFRGRCAETDKQREIAGAALAQFGSIFFTVRRSIPNRRPAS